MNSTLSCRAYSAREVAALLGIGHSTLCRHVREGLAAHLKPIVTGSTIRFPIAHIDQLTGGTAA